MSPYRDVPDVTLHDGRARKKPTVSWRRRVCSGLVVATMLPTIVLASQRDPQNPVDLSAFDWVYWLAPIGMLALIVAVLPVAANDAKARLCRTLWRRGDRGTAFGVYIGWIPLRLSQQRMDRNARAVRRFVRQRQRERQRWDGGLR